MLCAFNITWFADGMVFRDGVVCKPYGLETVLSSVVWIKCWLYKVLVIDTVVWTQCWLKMVLFGNNVSEMVLFADRVF